MDKETTEIYDGLKRKRKEYVKQKNKPMHEMISELKEVGIEITGMTFPEIFKLWREKCATV